ncbi:MAG: thioredoxin domain-containing protein [Patescibacteria group bacterium]|nr:thioredoxin domain-containing protein [Patescibacteria group bacterium]
MKRIFTWLIFIIIIILIVVGMIAASKKHTSSTEVAIPLPTPVTSADFIRGNPNAPVTIVEYGDFQCPACQAYYPVVEQVFAAASSTVRMAFREFPLPQHADAIPAAKAAEAAGNQGKFWGMYSLLYENGSDWDSLSDPTSVFQGYAQKLGLDMTKFNADMNSTTTAAKIQNSIDVGTKAGIDATPTFFINGYRIENPESYDEFIKDIQSAASSTTP